MRPYSELSPQHFSNKVAFFGLAFLWFFVDRGIEPPLLGLFDFYDRCKVRNCGMITSPSCL